MADIAKIRLGNQEGAYTEYDIKDAAARQATNDLDERVDEIEGNIDVKVQPSGGTFYRYGVPTTDNWCSKFVSKDIAGVVVETADEARKFNLRNPATSGICIASGAGQRWNIVAPNGYRIKTYKIVATLRDGQPEGVVFLTPQGGEPFQILPNSDITIEVSVNDASTYFLTEDVSTEPLDRQIWFKTFEVHVERTSSLATMDDVDRKQDKIDDLTTIRNGAAKGATSLQPTAQTLSDAQKAQARENIGAAALSEVDDKLADYAKKDGYYESMGVGTANNLRGSDVTQGTFLHRTAGGSADIASGNAYIEGVEGNEVVWNQIFPSIPSLTDNGVTYTNNGNGSITISGIATGTSLMFRSQNFATIEGHKYYLNVNAKSDYIGIYLSGSLSGANVKKDIKVASSTAMAVVSPKVPNGAEVNETIYPDIIDLTLAGYPNIATTTPTVAEVEAWLAQYVGYNGHYPSDAGTLLGVKMLGIKTVGFNAFDLTTGKAELLGGNEYEVVGTYTALTINGESVTLTNGKFTPTKDCELVVTGGDSTTCVHLVWSGIKDGEYEPYWEEETSLDVTGITGINPNTNQRETIFPNGMCGKGDWADVIYQSGGNAIAVKKADRVDLGSLTWDLSAGTEHRFTTKLSGITNIATRLYQDYIGMLQPVVSAKYGYAKWSYILDNLDKGMGVGTAAIMVNDSAYSDKNVFKTALNGVMLDYKLQTPIVYTDLQYADGTPFTLPVGYKVDDFGTEEIITPTSTAGEPTSCVPTIFVRYGVNAVDTIRRLPQTYISKESMEAFLATLGSAMNGTWAMTWDATNGKYAYTFTPNVEPEPNNE